MQVSRSKAQSIANAFSAHIQRRAETEWKCTTDHGVQAFTVGYMTSTLADLCERFPEVAKDLASRNAFMEGQ